MPVSFHIGVIPNRPLGEYADWVSLADESGFGGVWVADSQNVFRDAFIALTLFSQRTKRMELASGVTNPLTRHPAVLAQSFVTLDEISDGRAVLGIGTGDSSVNTLGKKPASLKYTEHIINVIRKLSNGKSVEFEGKEIKVSWPPRNIPIIYACTGPKSLQMVGRVADGALFQVGADPALVRYALKNIEIGAKAAGRDMRDLKLYQRLACAVSDNREQVRTEARGYSSVAANTVYTAVPKEDIPEDLYRELQHLREQYDYQQHASMDSRQAELVTDRILDAVSIAGTPEEAVSRFQDIVDLGVKNFVLPIATKNPESIIRMLAERVMPHVEDKND